MFWNTVLPLCFTVVVFTGALWCCPERVLEHRTTSLFYCGCLYCSTVELSRTCLGTPYYLSVLLWLSLLQHCGVVLNVYCNTVLPLCFTVVVFTAALWSCPERVLEHCTTSLFYCSTVVVFTVVLWSCAERVLELRTTSLFFCGCLYWSTVVLSRTCIGTPYYLSVLLWLSLLQHCGVVQNVYWNTVLPLSRNCRK